MLVLLSPAKSLDFESRVATRKHSEPRLLAEAARLVDVMRGQTCEELAELMDISEELATLNVDRFREFQLEHTTRNSRPAVLAFNGDAYRGLAAPQFVPRDFTECQKTLRILSGLYGLLRPLDLVQPHRLEMGTRLRTPRGRNLYEWWEHRVTDLLKRDLDSSPGADVVVNLASKEYFTVIDPRRLGVRVISPRFEDRSPDGVPRVVAFHAKRARGLMAAHLVKERARTPVRILDFASEGYQLDEARSSSDEPIFVR